MSNHARGLWGYSGETPAGRRLTIQATGMGGPSAAVVLADLAKLGVRRAVRVGTCTAAAGRADLGGLLLPSRAIAAGGSASSFGLEAGEAVEPDPQLRQRLRDELDGREAVIASLDTLGSSLPPEATAADMQTVAVFAQAHQLDIAIAAILIVSEIDNERLPDEKLEAAAKRAGQAAAGGLSNPKLEG
jgi:purine-nucleoside phosphorylase